MELLDFQEEASNQLAQRTVQYINEPVTVGKGGKQRKIPYLQLLSSITASGKTLVLADGVSSIAKHLAIKPVVLWLSKASVVVAQSYANLANGGAYHSLVDEFEVQTLAELRETDLHDSEQPFLLFATVGTFNQGKKGDGSLNVFKSAIDEAALSTWESLKLRPNPDGYRRPLLVVYDEAHNLSDQQTALLLELEPDAFLLATATSRLPQRFETDVIDHLKSIGGAKDDELTTVMDAVRVAESGLIKNELNLVGRQAPMEQVISEMHAELRLATKAAGVQGLSGSPKAVYICKTNVVEDSGERDNPKQPFTQRQAPPILIWRHLTEALKVKPSEIAVYCDLKVDKAFPLPEDFVLFKGGDRDYDDFTSGGFRHIIFNQSLQEGWDDPLVYFAYIDKSMGSKVQAEQIIGRLLRQPGREHYKNQRLNAAGIYVRVDAAGVFEEVVSAVEKKISTGRVDIKMTVSRPGAKAKTELPAKKQMFVPVAAIITERAEKKITEYLAKLTDFRKDDGTNTSGKGKRVVVQRIVGTGSGDAFAWEEFGDSASVLARWLFSREVARVHKGALGVALTSATDGSSSKFDARVGFDSPAAAHVTDVARKVGAAFVEHIYLKLRGPNPYVVGPILSSNEGFREFKNAVHKGYDGLNQFELAFAEALDKKKVTWCRNPSKSGYGIPLPQPGRTLNFFPDFLAWKGNDVFAIDTKGSQLHADAARKLVSIKPATPAGTRVHVRFVSDGVVDASGPQPESSGFTVWSFKPTGEPEYSHFDGMAEAVTACFVADI